MLSIHLTPQADHGWALQIRCSDSEVFAASLVALKAAVPAAFRRFDFVARCWIITAEGDEHLASYLELMRARYRTDVFAGHKQDGDADSRHVLPEPTARMTFARLRRALLARRRARTGDLRRVQDAGAALPPGCGRHDGGDDGDQLGLRSTRAA